MRIKDFFKDIALYSLAVSFAIFMLVTVLCFIYADLCMRPYGDWMTNTAMRATAYWVVGSSSYILGNYWGKD